MILYDKAQFHCNLNLQSVYTKTVYSIFMLHNFKNTHQTAEHILEGIDHR